MKLKGKKVLLTGACGFIGSHLAQKLVEEGCSLKAFVYYNSFGSYGWLEDLPADILESIEIFTGDIRDTNGVRTAVKGSEVIFHLAALIGIPYSYHSPDSYVDTNIKGTLNILQAARDHACEKILVTSTSEVYGTAQYAPIDEKHPRQGQSPYSATKIGADFMAESFYRSFDLPVTTVRPFNTYGPRQSARAVIPTIITQLLAGKTTVKLGALSPKRDMVFVRDTAEAFCKIAECRCAGEEINIATGEEISVGELASAVIDIINPKAVVECDEERIRPEKSEVMRLIGDCSKLYNLTGYRPQTSLREGLAETVEWFAKRGLKGYKPDVYNV
jgi:NAD dependent epimerase/dehydratase